MTMEQMYSSPNARITYSTGCKLWEIRYYRSRNQRMRCNKTSSPLAPRTVLINMRQTRLSMPRVLQERATLCRPSSVRTRLTMPNSSMQRVNYSCAINAIIPMNTNTMIPEPKCSLRSYSRQWCAYIIAPRISATTN